MRLLLPFVLAVVVSTVASGQRWPTTDWVVRSEDGRPLTGERLRGAGLYSRQLVGASHWFQGMGYRAPAMVRVGEGGSGPLGPYLALMKADSVTVRADGGTEADLGAVYQRENWSEDPFEAAFYSVYELFSPARRFKLSGHPGAWQGRSPLEVTFGAAPTHELFHAVQGAYLPWRGVPTERACEGRGAPLDWIVEGTATAVMFRWIEHTTGRPATHTYRDPSRMSWARYFDHSLHRPAHPDRGYVDRVAWNCGYPSWWFWHAAGEMLGQTPDQKTAYFQHIFEGRHSWADFGLRNVEDGLRRAARAYSAPARYDGGLYEIFPAFIAEYADDVRFYESPEEVSLRGGSEVIHREGQILPLAAQAFEVRVNVADDMPAGQAARVRITLPPQPGREVLHLVEGARLIPRPSTPEAPYEVELAVRQDTTLLIRVANVAEDGPASWRARYRLRLEIGGFYGASASVSDVPGIPPGFTVLSGPPSLLGCQGSDRGGSVFDLITADEAVADVRHTADAAMGAAEAALRRMETRGRGGQAQAMREAIEQARAEAEGEIVAEEGEARARTRGRSRLEATFVGQTADGTPCQILLHATLNGERGGFQTISTAHEPDPDDDHPVGIDLVTFLVGDELAAMAEEPFEICMMTEAEQRDAARGPCPTVCSVGTLSLERARQNHVQGLFRADVVAVDANASTSDGCPAVLRRPLVFTFNVASANEGDDGEVLRSMSDEMLRLLGATEREIDAVRIVD